MKMLQFCQLVLEKVSFDRFLFEKELKKAIDTLRLKEELIELQEWCKKKYSPAYEGIINKCFNLNY